MQRRSNLDLGDVTWFLHTKLSASASVIALTTFWHSSYLGSIPSSITPVLGFCQRPPGSSPRDAFWVLSFDQSKTLEITALSAYVSWSSRPLIDCWIKLSVCFWKPCLPRQSLVVESLSSSRGFAIFFNAAPARHLYETSSRHRSCAISPYSPNTTQTKFWDKSEVQVQRPTSPKKDCGQSKFWLDRCHGADVSDNNDDRCSALKYSTGNAHSFRQLWLRQRFLLVKFMGQISMSKIDNHRILDRSADFHGNSFLITAAVWFFIAALFLTRLNCTCGVPGASLLYLFDWIPWFKLQAICLLPSLGIGHSRRRCQT